MKDFAAILDSLVPLLWTGIAFYIVYHHRGALAGLVNSLSNREFNLEIGGQKLSFKQYNEQQEQRIADMEKRLLELEDKTPAPEAKPAGEVKSFSTEAFSHIRMHDEAIAEVFRPKRGALLWVDDKPENNALLVESLQQRGVCVELALNTDDAMRRLSKGGVAAIISDMGRKEDGRFDPKAGLELLKEVREMDKAIPFLLYTSSRSRDALRGEAETLQARVTSSSLDITRFVNAAFTVAA